MTQTFVVGTRASPLATAQTDLVLNLIRKNNTQSNSKFLIKTIRTEGDQFSDKSTRTGKELFTGTIDQALVDGEIDFAVHSLKDVPTEDFSEKGTRLCCFPKRGSPFDAFVPKKSGDTLESLPSGAAVGTSSSRRAIQLKNYRPDLRVIEIHGNVGTRIRKMNRFKKLDALVLAEAGLDRLLVSGKASQILRAEIILPAPGQGCLAISVRSDDTRTEKIVSKINHKETELKVKAERAFSLKLGGGCNIPIAALASIRGNHKSMIIEGLLATKHSGANFIYRDSIEGNVPEAESLGEELAERIKELSR
jgi:hydroxymethylbilane synthase